jgi:copper chaperone CopZ
MTREFEISGMSCDHCVAAVQKSVAGVSGVESAVVSLADEWLTVTGHGFRDEDVESAVADAGYSARLREP